MAKDVARELLHDAHLRYQNDKLGCNIDGLFTKVRKGVHRVAPKPSLLAVWLGKDANYRAMVCEHDKFMFDVCSGCHRDQKQARANLAKLQSRI